MPCEVTKYVGREVALEFVIACGDEMPAEDDWKLFGAGRTKSINPTWDTVDATADDTVGNIRTNLATWLAFEISADGVCRRSDSANSNQTELLKHFLNPVQTGGQPIIVVRVTMPDVTIVTAVPRCRTATSTAAPTTPSKRACVLKAATRSTPISARNRGSNWTPRSCS